MKKLLFVCTGNICRSPTAEAVMRHRLSQEKTLHLFHLDSAGIQAYHTGEAPDKRTQAVARSRGVEMHDLRARPLAMTDFHEYDYLFAMDKSHYHWMQTLAPENTHHKIKLYLEFAGIDAPNEVPDPYYGTTADFEYVCDLIDRATALLIPKLR